MKPGTAPFHWAPADVILDAYVPGTLRDLGLSVPYATDDTIAEAESLLRSASAAVGTGPSGLVHWSEPIGSSHIEGVRPATHRILHALASDRAGISAVLEDDVAEVMRNISAHDRTLRAAADGQSTAGLIAEAHACLMEGDPMKDGGQIRTVQNWVGDNTGPQTALYIPPPADMCPDLLDDLCWYIENTAHSPVLAASVSHAQFELIHPFRDGNGRTGRVIMHSILRRLLDDDAAAIPPVSLALSRDSDPYIDALTAMTDHGPDPDDIARSRAALPIIETVCQAIFRACLAVVSYTEAIESIKSLWRSQTADDRNPCVAHAIESLPVYPSMTVHDLRSLSGASKRRCTDALHKLSDLDVVSPRSTSAGLTVYDADLVIAAYEVMSATICDSPDVARRRYATLVKDSSSGPKNFRAP